MAFPPCREAATDLARRVLPEPSDAMRQPDSILVVSPDVATLQGLTRALLRTGLPVASGLGWAEGESRLQRIPVALLVTDVEELGPEELERLRRLHAEFPHVGVIALVSLPTAGVRTAKTEGLVLAVLEKPIALGKLEEAVSSALSRKAVQ
jgi:DNA-binding NtrC family response regulator